MIKNDEEIVLEDVKNSIHTLNITCDEISHKKEIIITALKSFPKRKDIPEDYHDIEAIWISKLYFKCHQEIHQLYDIRFKTSK